MTIARPFFGIVLFAVPVAPLLAQGDPPVLNPVVTTAERSAGSLTSSAAAVTRLTRDEVMRIPQATFADVLRTVPGFSVVDFDGLGFDPQLITRGFYGGGEAEYVVVLLDGKPMNQIHTGRALMEALPSGAAIEAVEIVRGGASALYGDAAIGGVINIITRPAGEGDAKWRSDYEASYGTFGLGQLGVRFAGSAGGWKAIASSNYSFMDGYRGHAERLSGNGRLRLVPLDGPRGHLAVDFLQQSRRAQDPGPLTESAASGNRRGSDVLFRFDSTQDLNRELALDGSRRLTNYARLTWFAVTGWRTLENTRTVALAPGFGDTKVRDADLRRTMGNVQLELGGPQLPLDGQLLMGIDVQQGSVESRYYQVAGGDPVAYAAASGERGAWDASGDADRSAAAAYLQYALRPARRVRVTLGGRYDRFTDDALLVSQFTSSTPAATHEAFSPKLGVNVQIGQGSNVYSSVGRSFKAPTLDQLFDQRRFPVPFPPFAIASSNAGLKPQSGVNVEAGAYHTQLLGRGAAAALSLSVYQMDMRDEIDFDVATLSYGNISRSRHRGVEAGARVTGPGATSAFASYTLQDATLQAGDNTGNRIKAIPRHALSSGVTLAPRPWLETGLTVTRTGEAYFDDENTRTIAAWTRADLRIGVQWGTATFFGEFRNVFDAQYVTTGYLDPAGSGTAYVYPAAGRVVLAGVRWGS